MTQAARPKIGALSPMWMRDRDYAFPVSRYSNGSHPSTCTESSLVAFRALLSALR